MNLVLESDLFSENSTTSKKFMEFSIHSLFCLNFIYLFVCLLFFALLVSRIGQEKTKQKQTKIIIIKKPELIHFGYTKSLYIL